MIYESDLSKGDDIFKLADINQRLLRIEAMQQDVSRKWQQPRDAAVEQELDKLKRGCGESDRVYGTGERGGTYEVRISRNGKIYKQY